ncbi:MAG: proprotein convertase P-domain-containing protein [Pseudomonadota bacterium]
MKTSLAGLATAILILPLASFAATTTAFYQTGPGLGLDLPDNNPVGVTSSLEAVSGDTLLGFVPDAGGIIEDVEVVISLDHTFIGDLIITLTSPEGTMITLLDRPVGDGFSSDSSNLQGQSFLYFTDRSIISAEDAGAGCDTDQIVGVSCLSIFAPIDATTAFAGENLLGTWTLGVSDNAALDQGDLNGWYIEIDFQPVPLPASVWLLGAALGGLSFMRRRAA